jgi:hypothetical protein
MKCSKCGYIRQTSDDQFIPASECPSCGIIYDKIADTTSEAFTVEAEPTESPLRASPVDAESLKKARQRVDQRLKERLDAQNGASRHNQTLEMARQFATEGVRKRQEQWKQQQAALGDNDDAQTEPPLESTAPAELVNDAEAGRAVVAANATEPDTVEAIANDAETETADGDKTACPDQDKAAEIENTASDPAKMPSREKEAAAMSGASAEPETDLDDPPQPAPSHTGTDPGRQRRQWFPGVNLAQLLPLAACLILIAGIGGAMLSWSTLAEAEADMQTWQTMTANATDMGLLLGLAYLVTGVLGFALFWVSSLISRQLKDIRRLLVLQSSLPERENDGPASSDS